MPLKFIMSDLNVAYKHNTIIKYSID